MKDDLGQEIEQREYNQKDMDRILVLNQRTKLVARRVMQYLCATNPFDKTIIFCEDIDHAERMRAAVVNAAGKLALDNPQRLLPHRHHHRIASSARSDRKSIDGDARAYARCAHDRFRPSGSAERSPIPAVLD